ncbi:hypothetical protein PENTCL1PPCAC_1842, partial [Pristionchus entomophagus]
QLATMRKAADDVKLEPDSYDVELSRRLDEIRLPTRDETTDVNSESYGVPTWCFLNVFNLEMDNSPKTIYKYELVFTVMKRGEEVELHNALIKVNEFARSTKRNALVTLTRIMHQGDKDFFRQQQLEGDEDDHYWRLCCAFDGGAAYYTGVNLPCREGVIPEEMWRANANCLFYIKGKGPIKWKLSLVETFRIDGENAKSEQALQFLNVLSMQKLMRDDSIDVKQDAAYLTDVSDVTRDQKELRKGIVTTSKVVGDNVCIQMDSKISMFFKSGSLLDYIRQFSNTRSERDLETFLRDKAKSRKLRKELFNLPLRCRHIATKKTFECKGIFEQSANEQKFMLKDSETPISVADYYVQRYQYRLNFPNLPLIIERCRDGNSYHAIECLDIADGIRVSNQKMSREAQENMITRSCRAPDALGKDLIMSREIAGLDGGNKYLKAFDVKTTGEFSTVEGKILAKPFLTGLAGIKPDINDRGQISYIKGGFKFADPAKPSKPIILLNLQAIRDNDCEFIKDELRRIATDFGMQIEFANIRDPGLFGGEIEPLRQFMTREKERAAMFFFLTKEKMDESHYMVKKMEQELGVVTQLVCAQTAQGILQKKRVTEFNIIAKMNQKLGGVVANPEVPPDLKKNNPDAYNRAVKDWFNGRMFVGFTLSHAGAQSFADRVVGQEVREPTCVGMAFTLKQPGKRTAMSWFQEKRLATMQDVTRHFVRALDVYAESNGGNMPHSILVFRKGMSEGELKKAALEMRLVMEAIMEVSKRPGMADYRPTVQCLVCMANTPDRLFYERGNANVPAGTCLEKGATHPNRLEFLIVPHNAIKGTAKAVRCTVVHNKQGKIGRRLELAELQSIYHAMCYLNGVAASPTRLPVPLSDSEKAAERQMNLFKETMRNGDDSMSTCSGGSSSGIFHDGSTDFYQRLSDQFAHKFRNNQYYA